jgi:hypothetical protein
VPLRTLRKFLRTVQFSFYFREDTLLHLLTKDGEPFFSFEGDKVVLKSNIPQEALIPIRHLVLFLLSFFLSLLTFENVCFNPFPLDL